MFLSVVFLVLGDWHFSFLGLSVGYHRSRQELGCVTWTAPQVLDFFSDPLLGGYGHYSTRGYLLFLPRNSHKHFFFYFVLFYFNLCIVSLRLSCIYAPCLDHTNPTLPLSLSDSSHRSLPESQFLSWSTNTDVCYCVGDESVALKCSDLASVSGRSWKPGSWDCGSRKFSCFQGP